MDIITNSALETEQTAEAFASSLSHGSVVALHGEMGAGKTAFVRGMAKGLGVSGEISSPTYSIVNEYPGKIPMFHFDMYRITDIDELYTTGFFDYIEQNGICVVEWSENIKWALPENTINVKIIILSETSRKIIIGE